MGWQWGRIASLGHTGGLNDMQVWNLIWVWLYLTSLTFAVLLTCGILAYGRRRTRSNPTTTNVLPDFAIFDCGDSIHLVPVECNHHRVDNTGRCQCRPVISINQRRRGAYVRYIDHQPAGWRASAPPSIHARQGYSPRHEHWWNRAVN